MKILHIVNSLETGGAQTLIETLASEHSRADVETHVVVLLGTDTLSERVEAVAASVTYLDLPVGALALPLGAVRLRRAIKALRPDVVHSHLLQSDLLTTFARGSVPHISTVHTSGGHESNWQSRVVTKLTAATSRFRSRVIACSPSAFRFSVASLGREPDDVILNAVELRSPDLSRAPGRAVITSLARWHPMKDHRNLLAAVSSLPTPKPQLVLAGSGIDEDNAQLVELLAEYANVDVTVLGAVADVIPHIDRSICLIIASAYGEALPMAGIESLSRGVPVVTTAVGDCDLLAIKKSYLALPSDPVDLRRALVAALGDFSSDATGTARLAYAKAESEFDARRAGTRYLGHYRSMLAEQEAR
ncbi:glycosyltransferase [Microbacterium sp. LWH3-1.2]|uniref:glycosyltransferase n=1 Tax=Microbacterium sp. LWH3-1.2 TaxID=3135256 RepID=UPI003415E215